MHGEGQSLISYRLRTVRVGLQATLLILTALLVFALIPSSVEFEDRTWFVATLVAAAAGAAVISLLPWQRLFGSAWGMRALYAWSVLDILLICALIALSGGDESPLFLLFGMTTVFFSASYPPRAQVALLLFTFVSYTAAILLVEEHIVLATFLARFSILTSLTFITSFLSRELINQNATLEAEILRHHATEAQLRKSQTELAEAQEVARLGSWSWDIKANNVVWSDQLFRIYGLDPGGSAGDYSTLMESVHEEDREGLNREVQRALDDNDGFALEHRIVRPDGEVRTLLSTGRVEALDGEPLRMVGTVLDITERKRNEETERRVLELQVRQQQAVEINDTVVQGLAVASYALDANDQSRAKAAVKKTLAAARSIVNQLLNVDTLQPGDLVRSRSATVITEGENDDGN
ncbi:MAG: PAS domain-containing protein [Actinomycetota bacterium]|nr:PAS domain-containing protein [Actinomycetota bacterium]